MIKEPIVKWIVDSRLLQDRTQEMVSVIENHGMVATVVDTTKNVESIYKQSDCVLAVGCIDLIKSIQYTPWLPGSFCNFRNFDCSVYYAHLAEYLLISDSYRIVPLGDLSRVAIPYIESGGELFFRPCNPYKTFVGQKFNYEDFIKNERSYGNPETLVVLGKYFKDTFSEIRYFCSGDTILGGSSYIVEGRQDENPINLNLQNGWCSETVKPAILIRDENNSCYHIFEMNNYSHNYELKQIFSIKDPELLIKYIYTNKQKYSRAQIPVGHLSMST